VSEYRALQALPNALRFLGWCDDRLDRQLAELDSPLNSELLVGVSVASVVIGGLGSLVVALVQQLPSLPLIAAIWVLVTSILAGILGFPSMRIQMRRARALGGAPDLLSLAVLRLRVSATPEGAAAFAASHGDGPLARDLARTVQEAAGRPESGWERLATSWADRLPELRRAVSLLLAATETDGHDRDRLLDTALEAVLNGTHDRMAGFATALHGPTTAIYAFGVVLPLAFVGALPTLRAAGINVGLVALAAVYDGMLPLALLGASLWLVSHRPVAFAPAPVPREHPALPPRGRRLFLAVPAVAAVGYLLSAAVFPRWAPPVVTAGLLVGSGLVVWYRPAVALREETRALETAFPDALTIVAQGLGRGLAPEVAIATVAERLPGPAGATFGDATRISRRRGVDPEAAFLGEDGALRNHSSPRLRSGVALLMLTAREGAAGATVLVSLAEHLQALQSIETRVRRELGTVVGTLRSTAWCFSPLIGGTTVALASRIDGVAIGVGSATLPTAGLATVVGVYVLLLAAILAGLATGHQRGPDRAAIGLQAGFALVSASLMYPLSVYAADLLV
jgi:Flp pilus assembly protein TadB